MFKSFVTPWTVAHQAPLSMIFPRQEYWSGLSLPSPGDPPNPEIEPVSLVLAGGFFTPEPPGNYVLGILDDITPVFRFWGWFPDVKELGRNAVSGYTHVRICMPRCAWGLVWVRPMILCRHSGSIVSSDPLESCTISFEPHSNPIR